MTNQNAKEIKVGIVTLVSLVVLIAGIVFGRGLTLRSNQPTLTIFFRSSGGIDVSAPVSVNGVKRGMVTRIEPYNNGVLVTTTMDNLADIKKDAVARLLMLEITGGKKIDIAPGQSSKSVQSGDQIQGHSSADISELIALVGDVADDAKNIVRRLDTVLTSATALLADGKVVNDTRQTLAHLRSLSQSADALLTNNRAGLQTMVDDLRILSSDLKKMAHQSAPKIDTLLGRVDNTIVHADNFLLTSRQTLFRADTLIANITAIVGDIRTKKQTLLHRLVYDESMGTKLDSLLISLRRVLDIDGVNVNLRLGTRP